MLGNDILIPESRGSPLSKSTVRNHRHRLRLFIQWLDATGRRWDQINQEILEAYISFLERDRLLVPLSIDAHISTIRGRYDELVSESRQRPLKPTPNAMQLPTLFSDEDAPDLAVMPTELLIPKSESIKVTSIYDPSTGRVSHPQVDWSALARRIFRQSRQQAETERIRLTVEQANALLNSPDTSALIGKRDKALIALMLCTGSGETETHGLDVPDAFQKTDKGFPALHIPRKQGCTERLIPYGNMLGARDLVEDWLKAAGISDGPLFRGIYKGGNKLRPGRIGLRSIGMILSSYPIQTGEESLRVTSLILRRTYARRLYEEGVQVSTIQQYLGLGSSDTTLEYIGLTEDDPQDFGPPSLYSGL